MWEVVGSEGMSTTPCEICKEQSGEDALNCAECLIEVLKKTAFFATVSDEHLLHIARHGKRRGYEEGEFIYRAGEPSESMHVIVSGKVNVVIDSGEIEIPIATIGEGETIGEMGLLEGVPRAASIRAATAVDTLELDGLVNSAFQCEAGISLEAMKMILRRLRNSNCELEKRMFELGQLYVRLQNNYQETVMALSNALELRDKVTAGHSDRVTAYSLIIGNEMGLSDEELLRLRLGALLHDLGKIGISDTILHKEGKLSEEEWAKMREHPELGCKIIRGIPFLEPAIDVVLSHHERWSGVGYPQNLSGEEIPLGARIFALADVFDALSMERSYKGAWAIEDVVAEIKKSAGTHFDPKVVDAFLRKLDDILTVLEKSRAGESVRGFVSLQPYKDPL